MADLNDGESVEMKGSGAKPYVLKNTGGVYSCTCPAWRNQSIGIERRTCKHLRKLRDEVAKRAVAVVDPLERSAAAGVTGTARTIGASLAPVFTGPLLASTALMGMPFFISGGLKIIYDVSLYRQFRALKPPEERLAREQLEENDE